MSDPLARPLSLEDSKYSKAIGGRACKCDWNEMMYVGGIYM